MMTNRTAIWGFGFLMTLSAQAWGGSNYSGVWAYQALNEEDTSFRVSQEGTQITFYRMLHPLFEGQRYQLEHMYQGKIQGTQIQGKLMVREEGMPDFEFLRSFQGKIENDNRMLMDEIILKRQADSPPDKSVTAALEETPEKKYSRVTIQRSKKEDHQSTVAPPKTKAEEPPISTEAPLQIPNLIPVARKIETGKAQEVTTLLKAGDDYNSKKQYQKAIEHYERAFALDDHKVEVLYKLGVGYGILGSTSARKGSPEIACGYLRKAISFWEKALKYDPYNWGAKENIRRAKEKIGKLSNQ